MNPFDFVRIDWTTPPQRRRPTPHHKFQGVSGQIEGTITAETPLFIRDPQGAGQGVLRFIRKNGQHLIPASSLKGAIRSLVETIGPGCFLQFDGNYREHSWPTDAIYDRHLPQNFRKCTHPKRLCVACRMFGTLVEKRYSETHQAFNQAGNVAISDGKLIHLEPYERVYLPPLFKPRPYHEAWYLSTDRQTIAGRKFYFHQAPPYYFRRRAGDFIQQVEPVGPGTTFAFTVNFTNLNPSDELPLLLYSLSLQPDIRHKIGYGKPAGLGSVRIDLTKLTLIDYATRYTNPEAQQRFTDQALLVYLQTQTRPHLNDTSETMQDLRRIWGWPPAEPPTGYGYPTTAWFGKNSQATIAESWDAPRQ